MTEEKKHFNPSMLKKMTKEEKEKYFNPGSDGPFAKCEDDLLNGWIMIYDVPFKYRDDTNYIRQFQRLRELLHAYPENWNLAGEKDFLAQQLRHDIIKSHKKGLYSKEQDLKVVYRDFILGNGLTSYSLL